MHDRRRCPKTMIHGPCGGVTPTGGCEVPGVRCPFISNESPTWAIGEATAATVSLPDFVVDFRPDLTRRREIEAVADRLDPQLFAVLVGDHVDEADNHAPPDVADVLVSAGLRVIATLSCRQRSGETLERDLKALKDAGVEAVHCVTGDHPAARLGLMADIEFPLDSFELVSLARSLDVTVSVAESPAARPTGDRARRLGAKAAAGASVAILNHAGGPNDLIGFAEQCSEHAPALGLVAPVPVITDHRSAAALDVFPGLVLPPGLAHRILRATSPREEGIQTAAEMGGELRRSGQFSALNLSGRGTDAGMVERAELIVDIAQAIGDAT